MHRRLRIAVPFAAMTVAASLTFCAMTTASAATAAHHAQPGLMVAAGHTAGRSAVPWKQVGPGWTLVTYTTATEFATHPKRGATTLYLVDPAGGKYVMYRWPHVPAYGGVDLLAWSGDATRAMLEVAKSPTSNAQQLDQLTLATGKLTRLPLPSGAVPISYTRPDGLAVLAYLVLKSPAEVQIVRYSLSGALEKVLYTQKTTKNGGGFVNISQSSPYNPAGTSIALTITTGSAKTPESTLLISNAGGVIHRYGSADSCFFVRWWTASQLLTDNCAAKHLFLTPAGGAAPKSLAPAVTSAERFVQDAWSLAGHVYVEESGPACGTGILTVIRNGHLAEVTVPKLNAGADVVTTSSSKLLIVAERCMASSGLLWFNPHNASEVQVLAKNQGQGVIGEVPYYATSGG